MDNLDVLKNSIKTREEVIELVGKETTLGFEFLEGGIATYTTLTPVNIGGFLAIFDLDLGVTDEDGVLGIFKYDSFSGQLAKSRVFNLSLSIQKEHGVVEKIELFTTYNK